MYSIQQSDVEELDKLIPKNLKPAPNSSKIHQLVWTNTQKDFLFLNHLSCESCFTSHPCTHFSLTPKSYCVLPGVSKEKQVKNSINCTKKNKSTKKKKI